MKKCKASKKARSYCDWRKHLKQESKRRVNKSIRKNIKKDIQNDF